MTNTRIAWGSFSATSGGELRGKIKISDIGLTARTVTTVAIPGDPAISSLSADYFGERFWITTALGDIYTFKSDGTDLVLAFDHATGDATVKNFITQVGWGAWFDSYNSNFYFCSLSSSVNRLYKVPVSGVMLSTPVVVTSANVAGCDGLGVDPTTEQVFVASYTIPDLFTTVTNAGVVTTVPTSAFVGSAASSMFVSHATSKIYFATEENVYEVNYDGTGLRSLYTSTHTSMGFENLAVYYGKPLPLSIQ